MREWAIVSAIKPKFDNQTPCWFTFFVQIANEKLFSFWFAGLTEQFQFHNFYKPRGNQKNCLLFFWLYCKESNRTGNEKDLRDLRWVQENCRYLVKNIFFRGYLITISKALLNCTMRGVYYTFLWGDSWIG